MHIKEHPLLREKTDAKVFFFYNNKPLTAQAGQTVAAALIAIGIKQFGVSRKLRQPRGLFCSNGRCCSCFVSINGIDHVLSCMVVIEEGMKIRFNDGNPILKGVENEL